MHLLQKLSRLGFRSRLTLSSALLLVLVLLVFPFESVVAPEWRLRVLDDAGQPVVRINVTEHWQHYLLETSGHEERMKTGDDGVVAFPSRSLRASFVRRGVAAVGNLWRHGRQARFRPYVAVVVWGSPQHATAAMVYRQDALPPTEIVVARLQ